MMPGQIWKGKVLSPIARFTIIVMIISISQISPRSTNQNCSKVSRWQEMCWTRRARLSTARIWKHWSFRASWSVFRAKMITRFLRRRCLKPKIKNNRPKLKRWPREVKVRETTSQLGQSRRPWHLPRRWTRWRITTTVANSNNTKLSELIQGKSCPKGIGPPRFPLSLRKTISSWRTNSRASKATGILLSNKMSKWT